MISISFTDITSSFVACPFNSKRLGRAVKIFDTLSFVERSIFNEIRHGRFCKIEATSSN